MASAVGFMTAMTPMARPATSMLGTGGCKGMESNEEVKLVGMRLQPSVLAVTCTARGAVNIT